MFTQWWGSNGVMSDKLGYDWTLAGKKRYMIRLHLFVCILFPSNSNAFTVLFLQANMTTGISRRYIFYFSQPSLVVQFFRTPIPGCMHVDPRQND